MRGMLMRSFAIAFVGFSLFFGLEFFLEWRRAGYPGVEAMSWAGTNNAKLVDVLSPMARAYNNLLAMLITMIGLAIPLTANMHTPKLIDMFLKDRVNRWVLTFIAFGAAHVLWVDYMIGPEFAPTWAIGLSVYLALMGWALLIPYFFYVVRFIDPSRLVTRLRDSATHVVEVVADRRVDPIDAQQDLATRVGQIGTIIIKSLDRGDRDVAAEGPPQLARRDRRLQVLAGRDRLRLHGRWHRRRPQLRAPRADVRHAHGDVSWVSQFS
jgi:uncharacterized membrane protein